MIAADMLRVEGNLSNFSFRVGGARFETSGPFEEPSTPESQRGERMKSKPCRHRIGRFLLLGAMLGVACDESPDPASSAESPGDSNPKADGTKSDPCLAANERIAACLAEESAEQADGFWKNPLFVGTCSSDVDWTFSETVLDTECEEILAKLFVDAENLPKTNECHDPSNYGLVADWCWDENGYFYTCYVCVCGGWGGC